MKELIIEILSKICKVIFGNIIILEDINGFTGNTGSVYEYMISHEKYKKYHFVWLVNYLTIYNMKKRERTKTYLFSSKNLYKKIARISADYIICDNIFITKKRKGQKLIYLTHGCPTFKNVKNLINVPQYVDFVICPSKNLVELNSYQYSVDSSKFFFCGLPRNDYLFNAPDSIKVGLNLSKYNKIIMWMPTFRKSAFVEDRNDSNKELRIGLPLIQDVNELKLLNRCLNKYKILLVVKLHPVQSDFDRFSLEFSNIIFASQDYLESKDINFYNLLGMADALITDYSSVAFDYMLVDKPIGYIIDDINEYKIGFAFDDPLSMMPGEKIKSIGDFTSFIKDVSLGKDDYKSQRNDIKSQINDYCDDKNTERFVNMFF